MRTIEQQKLDFLFEMENIKTYLMPYVAPGVNLKVVTDLGSKDKNGNKRRFYEETRYPSNKYRNTDYLVSSMFRINSYLVFEYPNPSYNGGNDIKNSGVLIRASAMNELISKMDRFNSLLMRCFKIKENGDIVILADKVKTITAYPTIQTSIQFSPDIYENVSNNRQEMGVRITFNEEYSFVVSVENVWPEMMYRISRCDLTLLGMQMIQSYMAMLPGMATSSFSGGEYEYSGSSRYKPFWTEDPEDVANRPESVSVNRSKPITRNEKINSFFSNL